jgi:class 3 adenylate cyclase
LRAGLHTGEVEMKGTDIGGIAVHAAARVMAKCQPGEVLVSRVVTDLVAGAGLKFSERGSQELKELPGRWDFIRSDLVGFVNDRSRPKIGPVTKPTVDAAYS